MLNKKKNAVTLRITAFKSKLFFVALLRANLASEIVLILPRSPAGR